MGKEPANDEGPPARGPRPDPWHWLLSIPRPIIIAIALVIAIGIGLLIRGSSDSSSKSPATSAPKSVYRDTTAKLTIADQLPLDPQYSQFLTLASESGWLTRLGGKEDFTIFAPDATAFSKLSADTYNALVADPDGAAKKLVEHHIVPGKVNFVQLVAGQVKSLTAADGTTLAVTVDGAKVTVDGAVVTKHDISASNGVIHVVDSVGAGAG